MMKLLAAGASPYVRKVRMTALIKGLGDHVDVVEPDNPDAATLRERNPLGKIPILLLDDGRAIYDSHVICEFLDSQVASPVLFPGDGAARWDMLTRAALADGILDSALLLVYEKRYRPEDKWVPDWIAMQQSKIDAAVKVLNEAPPEWQSHPDYSHITIAAALGYLDFRHEGKWRAGNPDLVNWLEKFRASVPAFDQTAPPPSA